MTIHAKTKPKCRQVTNATRNICIVRQTGDSLKISGTLIKLANSDCTSKILFDLGRSQFQNPQLLVPHLVKYIKL